MPVVGYKYYGRNIRPYLYSPEKKRYTILGITLFSLVVFGAFAIRPSLTTIFRLRQEVKEAREAKTFLDQKIKSLSQAQISYQLALEDLQLVDQALPRESAVPAILETLTLAAGRNNVSVEEITISKIEGQGDLKRLPLTIRVVGKLENLQKFISELEGGIRQMDVQKVKMNRSGENLEHLVAEIELITFFYE